MRWQPLFRTEPSAPTPPAQPGFRDPLTLAADLERVALRHDAESRRLRRQRRFEEAEEARATAATCRQWAADLRAGG